MSILVHEKKKNFNLEKNFNKNLKFLKNSYAFGQGLPFLSIFNLVRFIRFFFFHLTDRIFKKKWQPLSKSIRIRDKDKD